MPWGTRGGGQAMRVLVTEDDEILATAVAAGLRREGMAVYVALDGAAALEHVGSTAMTWWCWTGTCPACTATTSAGPWPRADPRPGC